jgi:uncharacterized protein DUF3106
MVFAAALLALSLNAPVTAPHAQPAPLRIAESWDDLSPGQRDRALKNYQHYMQLPDDKRRSIDQRYEKWKKMPRSDRDRFRKKHDEYRGLGLVGDD